VSKTAAQTLGIELVKDRQSKEPAREESAQVMEKCKEMGLLVGKAGLCCLQRAAAIFTTSPKRIEDFLRWARAGILKINSSTAHAAVDLPFGGWKASGIGPAEHGPGNREFFTRMQSIYLA
jgi:Aldehyde dehydrogenase family